MIIIKILITMAITGIATLKKWFSAGKYPTGAQFASLIDSFWHKEDLIEINKIKGLPEKLNKKCETHWGREVQEWIAGKNTDWWVLDVGDSFSSGFGEAKVLLTFGVLPANNMQMDLDYREFRIDVERLAQVFTNGEANDFVYGTSYKGKDVVITVGFENSYDTELPPTCKIKVLNPGNEAALFAYKIEVKGEKIPIENEIPYDDYEAKKL